MSSPFDTRRLWCRIYEERTITEDGVYAKDQLPESYAGSSLKIQFSQIMVFAQGAGPFYELSVMDFEGVKDSGGQEGIGLRYTIFGEEVIVPAKGPSTHITEATVKFLTDNFTAVEHQKLEFMYRRHLLQTGVISDD